MNKTQTNTKLPPRISIFDKRAQNQFLKDTKMNVKSVKGGGAPQFRINQHKGA
jgi:hypothetical protein